MSFVHDHRPLLSPQPGDRILALQSTRLLARVEGDGTVNFPAWSDLPRELTQTSAPRYLGTLDEPLFWFSPATDATSAPPEPWAWAWHETRALLATMTKAQCQAVSCARELHWWQSRHRFCGCCGSATVDMHDERARQCPRCEAKFYPSAAPAVIVAVTRGDRLLLAHNRNFRPGLFSLLAGFVDPGETLEQAVVREVQEETGIQIGELRYVSSQPWPFPNSLMAGFRATHISGEIKVDALEIEQAGWFHRDELPDIPSRGTVARELIDGWLRNPAGDSATLSRSAREHGTQAGDVAQETDAPQGTETASG